MTQFTDKNQQLNKPAGMQPSHSSPKAESSSLSAQSSKLNLSVKIPPKSNASPKLEAVQMKSNPQAGAEPGQVTDADVINTVTHLVKAATVHPLGSSSANRELRNQKANLDSNKEARTKASDQAAKNQQIIEQDKIQQKNTIERTNTREGPAQAGKEAKVDVKTDRVIKHQIAKGDSTTEHKTVESAQKEVQRFKEEHARSQSANNANASGLASRNTSIEGEKETLTKDLGRERASEKKPAVKSAEKLAEELKVEILKAEVREMLTKVSVETRPAERTAEELKVEVFRTETKDSIVKVNAEIRQSDNRVVEVQRQVAQATTLAAQTTSEQAIQEAEDELFESWVSRDERRSVGRKKKRTAKQQLAREAKRALRKMTPLERRKAKMKRERSRKMRKRSRRRNRGLVFR